MTIEGLSRRALLEGRLIARPVASIGDGCLAVAGIVCRCCGDACPESAIVFRLRLGAPPQPDINGSACSGCGCCLSACPASVISFRNGGRA